jgi:hypothetical protein
MNRNGLNPLQKLLFYNVFCPHIHSESTAQLLTDGRELVRSLCYSKNPLLFFFKRTKERQESGFHVRLPP